MKIPALDNMTPVEAAKTDKGRSMLKELLKDIENTDGKKFQKESASLPCCKDEEKTGIVKKKRRIYFGPKKPLNIIPILSLLSCDCTI